MSEPARHVVVNDALDALRAMPDGSVEAVVTDPPYGLAAEPDAAEVLRHWLAGDDYRSRGGGFMGKSWDSFVPGPAVWRECLRVLRPGGHLLAFAGTRTCDLMGLSIRLGGFERRDTVCWLYGSGFPKSRDVSKEVDRRLGAEREVVGSKLGRPGYHDSPSPPSDVYGGGEGLQPDADARRRAAELTEPATPEGEAWRGWGTALKPAHEPIIVARRPPAGPIAANVLEHGVGALNVAGCSLAFAGPDDEAESKGKNRHAEFASGARARQNQVYGEDARSRGSLGNYDAEGRWPPNVALDAAAAAALDEQAGRRAAGNHPAHRSGRPDDKVYGTGWSSGTDGERRATGAGGASRFFYCAKASRAEREAGLDGFEPAPLNWSSGERSPGTFQSEGTDRSSRNPHPTVKPVELMRWLVRLVTPPGGAVLDPFCGSGSTGVACALEGLGFVGIDNDPDYADVARARIEWWERHRGTGEAAAVLAAGREREAIEAAGQIGFEL